MRVYILERKENLPPLAFSSLKKARDWCRFRYPLVVNWEGPYFLESNRIRYWTATAPGVEAVCITSVVLDVKTRKRVRV